MGDAGRDAGRLYHYGDLRGDRRGRRPISTRARPGSTRRGPAGPAGPERGWPEPLRWYAESTTGRLAADRPTGPVRPRGRRRSGATAEASVCARPRGTDLDAGGSWRRHARPRGLPPGRHAGQGPRPPLGRRLRGIASRTCCTSMAATPSRRSHSGPAVPSASCSHRPTWPSSTMRAPRPTSHVPPERPRLHLRPCAAGGCRRRWHRYRVPG